MREILDSDPTLSAGLKGAAQAFEYIKRLDGYVPKQDVFMFSDFEEATDHVSHEVANLVMENFLQGLGVRSPYIVGYFKFLCQPVLLDEHTYGFQGIPMGTPGSKIVLHIIGKVMSHMAKGHEKAQTFEELKRNTLAIAGDDVVDLCNQETAKRYPRCARILRMKPSAMKTGGYRFGGPYCEVAIRRGNFSWRTASNDPNSALVDTVRARLLSKETKQGHGDEDRNPVFGKAQQLFKELEWCPEYYPGMKSRVRVLFARAFRLYLKKDVHVLLRPSIGGLGVWSDPATEWPVIYSTLPEYLKGILGMVSHATKDEVALYNRALRILRSWSSPQNYVRGLATEEEANPFFEEAHLLSSCFDLEEVVQQLVARGAKPPSDQPRRVDLVNFINQHGYYCVEDALDRSCRPFWEIKDLKVSRGWPTRPFNERSRIQEVESRALPFRELTYDDFVKLMSKDIYPRKTYAKRDEAVFLEDGTTMPLNLIGSATGDRLLFGIPNSSFLRLNAADAVAQMP
jgi:hypothetical protein